jgi:hypothetical protein
MAVPGAQAELVGSASLTAPYATFHVANRNTGPDPDSKKANPAGLALHGQLEAQRLNVDVAGV